MNHALLLLLLRWLNHTLLLLPLLLHGPLHGCTSNVANSLSFG